MQAISRKFIRVARWVGLVLIAAAVRLRRPRSPLRRRSRSHRTPPTGWLSGGEYPITATVTQRSLGPVISAGASDRRAAGSDGSISAGVCPTSCTCHGLDHVSPTSCRLAGWRLSLVFTATQAGEPDRQPDPIRDRRTQTSRFGSTTPRQLRPTGLAVVGATGWRAENRFAVRGTTAAGRRTPYAAAVYRICPATNRPVRRHRLHHRRANAVPNSLHSTASQSPGPASGGCKLRFGTSWVISTSTQELRQRICVSTSTLPASLSFPRSQPTRRGSS